MKKSHLIIPSLLIGTAALLGVRTAVGALPLGLDAGTANDAKQQVMTASGEDQLATQSAALDVTERKLRAAARAPLPALPAIPARATASAYVAPRSASRPIAPALPQAAPRSTPAGDDDGDRDEYEHEEHEHDDDHREVEYEVHDDD